MLRLPASYPQRFRSLRNRPPVLPLLTFTTNRRSMKRKAGTSPEAHARKGLKLVDYCSSPARRDSEGVEIWPAPNAQIVAARAFLQKCAGAQKRTLIVPDKDADGLSSGVIVHRTLVKLGLDAKLLDVHLVQKGSNVHEASERKSMLEKQAEFIIVLDQGSRGGPAMVDDEKAKSLVIDHHLSDEFPRRAEVVSACHCPPVAPTSLITYEICRTLHPDIASECGYLCAIGTHGDLGNTLKWLPPFPDMTETFKAHAKRLVNDCVSYINAPRRTGTYDVITAWNALLDARDPREILSNRRLASAREEVNMEVKRQAHTPPKFSKDGRIAVVKINSKAQVHPVIATRWASHLQSKALEIVMVANYGYLPGKVNFSCRIARCVRDREPPVDIISSLKAVADLDTGDLVRRLGESFARGHREASGGIVPSAEFEELCALMRVGEKPDGVDGVPRQKKQEVQENTLHNYFKKP
ncbi:hypothetical protein PZA11_005142 [Diplocarpon coronariae]